MPASEKSVAVWAQIRHAGAQIPRMPRGHPHNKARAILYRLVASGVPPLEARRQALEAIK